MFGTELFEKSRGRKPDADICGLVRFRVNVQVVATTRSETEDNEAMRKSGTTTQYVSSLGDAEEKALAWAARYQKYWRVPGPLLTVYLLP